MLSIWSQSSAIIVACYDTVFVNPSIPLSLLGLFAFASHAFLMKFSTLILSANPLRRDAKEIFPRVRKSFEIST